MTTTEFRHEGSYKDEGRLTPKGSTESHQIYYELNEFWNYLDYGRGVERRKTQNITGTISPVPKGLQPQTGPHILEMKGGRLLDCWLHSAAGEVKCQDRR
jgi:hypothetical protein